MSNMKVLQLESWEIRRIEKGIYNLLLKGPKEYAREVSHIAEGFVVDDREEAVGPEFDWSLMVEGRWRTIRRLRSLLDCLKNSLWILQESSPLRMVFALDFHGSGTGREDYTRSIIGEWVYKAKSYDPVFHRGNLAYADKLARRMIGFVRAHLLYCRADTVVGVPPGNPHKAYDLSAYLAERIARSLRMHFASDAIEKVRPTIPQKRLFRLEDKEKNVREAFRLTSHFERETVIIVDDLYQSGATLREVAREIRRGKAARVLGLVATKTHSA